MAYCALNDSRAWHSQAPGNALDFLEYKLVERQLDLACGPVQPVSSGHGTERPLPQLRGHGQIGSHPVVGCLTVEGAEQLLAGPNAQLAVGLAQMPLDRLQRDDELRGDLAIGVALTC